MNSPEFQSNPCFSRRSRKFAVGGCRFGRLLIFDLVAGRFVVIQAHSLKVHGFSVVVISSSDRFVITASKHEKEIMVWNSLSGTRRHLVSRP